MKKVLLLIAASVFGSTTFAQNGLEQVIVEKYYKSEANDTNANLIGGVLPVGSVTYRIYADMLPGYKFQAAFGVPGHELRLETSTLFFNNEDRGAIFPTFTKNQSRLHTVMLDSWLSVGAACAGYFGILKSEDDGVNTNINNYTPQVMQGADPSCGIPISTQDGLIQISGRAPESVTTVGIDTIMAMFNNQNDGTNGPIFSTFNGSWASLNGSVGPDSAENKVLIAQMTTNGNFSFKLNIQIGTPTGGFEQYVAENPVGNEIQIPSLIYDSSVITNLDDLLHANTIFRLYPNPTNRITVLELMPFNTEESKAGDDQIEVFSLSGQKLVNKRIAPMQETQKVEIDFADFQPGIYLIKIKIGGIQTTKRVLKY
ncbi:MAG: Secretion system C-terminal sorting domain [Bacteroidota bacterium]|jgi:hypothetical protein